MSGTPTTRAGRPGSIDTDALKTGTHKTDGFGVFAYYTQNQGYNTFTSYGASVTPGQTGQTAKKANFMFNQQVKWNASAEAGSITSWTYSPMKYWPNEVQSGAVDDQDNDTGSDPATTTYDNGGNVSFFAYAPYVELSASALDASNGITHINGANTLSAANNVATDPIITYVVPTAADEIVDLLWGTYGSTSSNVHGTQNTGVAYNASGSNYEKAILPHWTSADKSTNDGYRVNADLTKQKTNGKVDFAFKHALAKVGGSETYSTLSGTPHGLMVVADIDDQKGAEKGGDKSSATRITITDVQITARALYDADSDDAIEDDEYLKTMQGDFNLATGQWKVLTTSNIGATAEAATTQHNIVSPASAVSPSSAELNDVIAEPATANITTNWNTIPTGVTTTPQNVYKSEATPLVFIPGTYPELTITINYTVRSNDSKLAEGAGKDGEGTWTYVKQVITKKVRFANPVELNKQYSLLMHLGLTSVKFTAEVSNWEVDGDTNNNGTIDGSEELIVTDVNLPINVQDETTAQSVAAGSSVTVNTLATTTTYNINMTGLTNGSTMTCSAVTGDGIANTSSVSFSPATITSDGITTAAVTLSPNTTTKNRVNTVTIKEGSDVTTTVVTITQKAGILTVETPTWTSSPVAHDGGTITFATLKAGGVAVATGDHTITIVATYEHGTPASSTLTGTISSDGVLTITAPANTSPTEDVDWTVTKITIDDTSVELSSDNTFKVSKTS